MKQIDDIFKIVAPLVARLNESRDPNRDANLADVNKIMELATEIETELKPALKTGTDAFVEAEPVEESVGEALATDIDNNKEAIGLTNLINAIVDGDPRAITEVVTWLDELEGRVTSIENAIFEPRDNDRGA